MLIIAGFNMNIISWHLFITLVEYKKKWKDLHTIKIEYDWILNWNTNLFRLLATFVPLFATTHSLYLRKYSHVQNYLSLHLARMYFYGICHNVFVRWSISAQWIVLSEEKHKRNSALTRIHCRRPSTITPQTYIEHLVDRCRGRETLLRHAPSSVFIEDE